MMIMSSLIERGRCSWEHPGYGRPRAEDDYYTEGGSPGEWVYGD